MQEITRQYLISGRVQGVGFRAFAKRLADEIGLRGWARNLRDGRVEVIAEGSPENQRLYQARLKSGPAHGEVESLTVTDWPLLTNCQAFTVRGDGDPGDV